MAETFEGLDEEAAALSRYGMPRSLNAGDGFYALAQSALLHAADAGNPEERLAAIHLLDATCAAFAGELHARLQSDYSPRAPALHPAALAFAALAAGAPVDAVNALGKGDVGGASLPAGVRAKIEAALHSLA
jgi:hypothetical protein